jgi:hypothetical protein
VGSFLEETRRSIKVVPFEDSTFKAILASPTRSHHSDSQSKSPSSSVRSIKEVAVQVDEVKPLGYKGGVVSFGRLDDFKQDRQPVNEDERSKRQPDCKRIPKQEERSSLARRSLRSADTNE